MDQVHYARMSKPALPFGDGHAAPRIARLIEDYVAGRSRVAL
jgi:UDP-N-acetylglucosamine 2-epimerase